MDKSVFMTILGNNVSVVIATLGGELLKNTIENLNGSSVKPYEILICIPREFSYRVKTFHFDNVKIIETKVKGQVAQRAEGFILVNCPYVLQLDDDIILERNCIKNLISAMDNELNLAVSPMLYDSETGRYHEFMVFCNRLSITDKILLRIVNGSQGYEPGKITKSGLNFGLPETPCDFHDLDWLPGACVLHRKTNLITHDYFPLNGKAFSEDLFHSSLLREAGIRLGRVGSAICYVDFTSSKVSLPQLFVTYLKYYRSMRIYVVRLGKVTWRLQLYIIFRITQLIANKIAKYVSVKSRI